MAERFGLCMAVDKTLRGQVGVRLAESSAERLGQAWGLKPGKLKLLLGHYATKAVIDATLTELKQTVKKTDALYVYISVPTLKEEDNAYLAPWDALGNAADFTAYTIAEVLERLGKIRTSHTFVFLETEYALVEPPPGVTVFQSCSTHETPTILPESYCSAWVKVLAMAFEGRLPIPGKAGATVVAFQDAIVEELRRILRKEADVGAEQTPSLTTTDTEAVVFNLKDTAADRMSSTTFSRVFFRHTETVRIKDLPGYRKTFRMPDRVDASSNRFVAKMADALVQDDLNANLLAVRGSFGFARKDVAIVADRDGGASLRTPLFVYRLRCEVNTEELTNANLIREVGHIADRTVIQSPAWAECFGSTFNELVLEFEHLINLEAMIDSLETSKIKGLKITELPGGEACTVKLAGFAGAVTLTRNDMVIHGSTENAMGLLEVLMKLLNEAPEQLALGR